MNLSNLMPGESRKKISRLLCITALSTCSVFAYAQQQQVKLTGSNLPLKSVFKQIEKQTDLSIDYRSQDVDDSRIVKQMPKATTVQQAMNQLLAGTDCVVTFSNGHIIIKKQASNTTNQQSKRVKGTIVDATGMPVIGANVMVKGTTNGTITDMDGNFSLDIEEGATLVVSYIGFTNQEIKVGKQTNLSITMKEDSQSLDEVVVVGFGTQKKLNLTGAVTAVSGETITKRPVVNTATMLQGQVPGLRVNSATGTPGNESTSFRIRGQGTFSSAGSDPLILVNGVPGSITNLDPSVIESVSVLKDAASAAIYGARAANGVILVTTKEGADVSDGKAHIGYHGNVGLYTPTRMYDLVTNSAEYMELFNLAQKNSGLGNVYTQEQIDAYRNGGGS
ncbi:MAG: carboxypeptidase-like regulatory domain-containing protein, partial [Parabacteroides sp.]|nr:carboxypeptidase-like regulatory domain-containing protein [Parabacteroides sp.]